ncbi:MAG: hypothetical protein IT223_08665, partial [Crocinitomicaceae bacterium]|nr:hypothetical protein [Crocinitomicaceae bacterium]
MTYKLRFFLVLILFLISVANFAQGVRLSDSPGDPADPSALLEIRSTTQGLLLSRMTQEERDAIPNPAMGLVIYNTATNCINVFNGTDWTELCNLIEPSLEVEVQLMTTEQRDNISNPSAGLTILNTTTGCTNIFDGSTWLEFCSPVPLSPEVEIQLMTTVQRDAII